MVKWLGLDYGRTDLRIIPFFYHNLPRANGGIFRREMGWRKGEKVGRRGTHPMTVSTCRDCAVRSQLEGIKKMITGAHVDLLIGDLDKAYQLISDAKTLLGTVIAIKGEL